MLLYTFTPFRYSDMYAKAAKTMAFYAKRGLNLLDVFMTNYTSTYYEKANSEESIIICTNDILKTVGENEKTEFCPIFNNKWYSFWC